MTDKTYNVLFICTGNAARSIIAEAILSHLGQGHFRVYSAGSHPSGAVHPLTLEVLQEQGYTTTGLRSKSWTEFAKPGAPKMDFIFTVCDRAAGEACPAWPGQPITAHWNFADPAAVEGDLGARRKAFQDTVFQVSTRIRLFLSLPLGGIDRLSLQHQVREVGEPGN